MNTFTVLINPITLLIIPLIGSFWILISSMNSTSLQSVLFNIIPASYSLDPAKENFTFDFSEQRHNKSKSPKYQEFKILDTGNSLVSESTINSHTTKRNSFLDLSLKIEYNLTKFQDSKFKNVKIKKIALITSLLNLIVSIFMWIQFDSNYMGYQFIFNLNTATGNLNLNFGVDGISLYFVLLTTFITPIALLSAHNDIDRNLKFYLISILLLETLQIAVFVSLDLLLFYVFFESVLIPLFLLIGTWGSSSNRVRAAFLLFLYTLFGSLFMLLSIAYIAIQLGSTDFALLSVNDINLESQKLLWLGFFIAFATKTPLWPLTGWLFRAHVEAPLSGSVILAAIILKLATYAYLRILIGFLPDATHYFTPFVQGLCVVTLIYASLSALRSHDAKALVALSSVAHCAVIVLGLFSNSVIGLEGALLLGIAHGFVSPALFICVGGIIYTRIHSRIIPYMRGLTVYMPLFSIFFLIFTLANASIPLTAGWVAEQMTLIGLFAQSPIIAVFGGASIFLTACYSVFMYNRIMFGQYSPYLKPIKDINKREFVVLLSLLIPTIFLGIWPNLILDSIHLSVSNLIYNIPLYFFYTWFIFKNDTKFKN